MVRKGLIRVLILVIALALGFCFSTEGFGRPRKRKPAVEEEKRKEDREKPAVEEEERKEPPPETPTVRPERRRELPPPQTPAVRPQRRRELPPPQTPAVRPQPRRESPPPQRRAVRPQRRREPPPPQRPAVRPPHRHHVPSYGRFDRSIPRHSTIRWKGKEYFYHRDRGVFYQRRGDGFVILRPPFGIVVPFLPPGFVPFFIGGIPYYYYGDVFYRRVPSGYVVVQAPHVLVRAYILNVRSGPGMGYPVIDEVYEGDVLVISGYAPGWLYVQLPHGSYGWVSQKFTQPVRPVPSG